MATSNPTVFVALRSASVLATLVEKATTEHERNAPNEKSYAKQIQHLKKQIKTLEDRASNRSTTIHEANSLRLRLNMKRRPELRALETLLKDLPAKRDADKAKLEALKKEQAQAASSKKAPTPAMSTRAHTVPPPPQSGNFKSGAGPAPIKSVFGLFGSTVSKPKICKEFRKAPSQHSNVSQAAAQAGKKRKARDDEEGEEPQQPTRPRKLMRQVEHVSEDGVDVVEELAAPTVPRMTSAAVETTGSTKRKASEDLAETEKSMGRVPKKVKQDTTIPSEIETTGGKVSKKGKKLDNNRVEFSPSPEADRSEIQIDSLASAASQAHKVEESVAITIAGLSGGVAVSESGSSTPAMAVEAKIKEHGRKKREISAKGVAVSKKRPAAQPNDIVGGGQTSTGRVEKPKRVHLNGIINHQNSCFSSVVLQLLDAALNDKQVDQTLGVVDEDVEMFGLSEKDARKMDCESMEGMDKGLQKKQKALHAAIKKAAKAGESDKISAAKHLRSMLNDLRQEYHGVRDRHVSAYVFQSVLAFGRAEDADRPADDLSDYQQMSGDTQEDAFEYFQLLLNTLTTDTCANDGEALQALFEIQTEIQDVCKNADCTYQSTARIATSNYHDVSVPALSDGQKASLQDLLRASRFSKKDDACPQCGNNSLTTQTKFTKTSDNLVIKMNRAAFDQKTRKTLKIDTFVDLKPRSFKLNGQHYKLSVVIRHSGAKASRGHYTALRRLEDSWYLLDDKMCDKKVSEDVKDHVRLGKSAMLLFKKVNT